MESLPNELLMAILRFALRPDGYLDGIFEPKELNQIVRLLAMDIGKTEAINLVLRWRRDLKLVCQHWRTLLDTMAVNDWVAEYTIYDVPEELASFDEDSSFETDEPDTSVKADGTKDLKGASENFSLEEYLDPRTPIKTKDRDGLRIVYRAYTDSPLGFTYTHPVRALIVKTLRLGTSPWDKTNLQSLSHIISYPKQLRVFHLGIEYSVEIPAFLSYLADSTMHLTTLSLDIKSPYPIPNKLFIPSLHTLILALSLGSYGDIGDWTSLDWTFPALRNLSIDQNEYPTHVDVHLITHLPKLYEHILERHQDQIVSFRINPPYMGPSNTNLPLCWIRFPKLEAFAVNFEQGLFVTMATTEEDLKADPSKKSLPVGPASLRHLIQLTDSVLDLEDVMFGLIKVVEICASLETITLPGSLVKHQLHMYPEVANYFAELCEERSLKVQDMCGEMISLSIDKRDSQRPTEARTSSQNRKNRREAIMKKIRE